MSPIYRSQSRPKGASIIISVTVLVFTLCVSMPSSAQNPTATTVTNKNTPGAAPSVPDRVPAPPAIPPARPVRSVTLVAPKIEMWPDQIEANGNIMPWQETRIGTEIGGLRLVSVLANVGDVVKKGQVLARLNPATVENELDAANAQLMEAQAALAQATATLDRGKRLAPSGGVSQQEMTLYETQKQTASARLSAARAQAKTHQLRLDSATLVAPDDGVISSRSAAEGAIVQAGSELFRLIRQGRLEWCAEVNGETLLKLAVGQEVTVKSPLGSIVKGRVRQVSPTIDLKTRNGFAYVDLPLDTNLKAGLYVSGTLALRKREALSLPASAVRHGADGAYVFRVNADGEVEAVEVQTGRVNGDREEIISGLDRHAQVIAKDVKTLKAGESVKAQGAQKAIEVTEASREPGKSDD